MKEMRRRGSNGGNSRLLPALILGLAVVILAALVIGGYGRKSSTVTPSPSASASPTNAATGDQTKSQFAPSATKSTGVSPSPSASSPAADSANYIASFSVVKRSDGFHVATVITGVTSGTCNLTITPTGQAVISKTGTVMLSGQTYMCDFGGDIAGSGNNGAAALTVTAPGGTKANSDTTF